MGSISNAHKSVINNGEEAYSSSTTTINTSSYSSYFCEKFNSTNNELMKLSSCIPDVYEEMIYRFNDLRTLGIIDTEDELDFKAKMIISNMDQARIIAEKRVKSFEEIHDFNYICKNFMDTYNKLKGGDDCA
ncbi:hypothetical protein [Clostridium culturomicium]|uniref:hypothetical protein n=1 Tax=Clostridium culturomicium TaxID=1499683 RepID=UPI000590EC3A|nr:hypothetical protein [Clostridium culturomicium]